MKGQLSFDLEEKLDLWNFKNWDWLKGDPYSLRIWFKDTIKRLNELMKKEGKKERYVRLKIDAEKRLKELKG